MDENNLFHCNGKVAELGWTNFWLNGMCLLQSNIHRQGLLERLSMQWLHVLQYSFTASINYDIATITLIIQTPFSR